MNLEVLVEQDHTFRNILKVALFPYFKLKYWVEMLKWEWIVSTKAVSIFSLLGTEWTALSTQNKDTDFGKKGYNCFTQIQHLILC